MATNLTALDKIDNFTDQSSTESLIDLAIYRQSVNDLIKIWPQFSHFISEITAKHFSKRQNITNKMVRKIFRAISSNKGINYDILFDCSEIISSQNKRTIRYKLSKLGIDKEKVLSWASNKECHSAIDLFK